jgi:hypothetical protein
MEEEGIQERLSNAREARQKPKGQSRANKNVSKRIRKFSIFAQKTRSFIGKNTVIERKLRVS